MCLVMGVVRKCKVTPLQVFLQAAVGVDPEHFDQLARFNHRNWLMDDEVPPAVEEFCRRVLTPRPERRRKKHRR